MSERVQWFTAQHGRWLASRIRVADASHWDSDIQRIVVSLRIGPQRWYLLRRLWIPVFVARLFWSETDKWQAQWAPHVRTANDIPVVDIQWTQP